MSRSMQQALDLLNKQQGKIDLSEFGFIMTVLRDNAENDHVHKLLDEVVKKSWEISNQK